MKLIKKAVDISIHNILAFPYEIYLVALYSAFSIGCTLLFWKVLFLNVMPQGYRPEFIYILAFCGLCSDGLCDVFFGLRDLDYLVRTGEFDRYLVRPRHPLYLVVLENMPVASILEKLILSVGGIFLVCLHFEVSLELLDCMKAVGFLLIGVSYYELLYGLMTVFSLRFEGASSLRDLAFQLNSSKQYPLSIFPMGIKVVLTYIIPVGLLAYYPAVLLLGMEEPLPKLYLTAPVLAVLAPYIYGRCIRHYSSNGG